MEKDLEKQIKKEAKKQVQTSIAEIIHACDMEDSFFTTLESVVEQKVDDLVAQGENLEELIIKSVQSNFMQWVTQNLHQGDIKICIRSAMINQLSKLSLEQLTTLAISLEKQS